MLRGFGLEAVHCHVGSLKRGTFSCWDSFGKRDSSFRSIPSKVSEMRVPDREAPGSVFELSGLWLRVELGFVVHGLGLGPGLQPSTLKPHP